MLKSFLWCINLCHLVKTLEGKKNRYYLHSTDEKDETQGDPIIEVFMARKYGKIKVNAKYFDFYFLALPISYYCLLIYISLVGNTFSHLLMFPSHEGHSISLTPDLFPSLSPSLEGSNLLD